MKDKQPGRGRLEGRRIMITGAASGMGRATARLFVAEGARTFLLDRNDAGLALIADALGAPRRTIDIADEAAVRAATEGAAAAMDGIDGVVNVAGIGSALPFEDHSLDDWNRIIAVNLTGPFLLCREALPHLRKSEQPTIVNVSSATALLPTVSGFSCYAASKGGLVTLTKALAYELAPQIRVNAVCPGATEGGMMSDGYRDFARSPQSPYALKRTAEPEELAEAILYLTSPASSYVTGIALAVDGGRSFH